MKKLAGYHHYLDRLRTEGNLHFWCSCGQTTKVELHMPLTMKCFCDRLMIVVDKNDLP